MTQQYNPYKNAVVDFGVEKFFLVDKLCSKTYTFCESKKIEDIKKRIVRTQSVDFIDFRLSSGNWTRTSDLRVMSSSLKLQIPIYMVFKP